MKTWSQFKTQLAVTEAVLPVNRQFGFLGTAKEKSHELLDKAVGHVKKAAAEHKHFKVDDKVISHYLDSKGGRHLADMMTDNVPDEQIHRALKNSLGEFSKTYNPALFESFLDYGSDDLQEQDPHLTKVYAAAQSTEGRYAAAKRKEADRKAREAYLAKKAGHVEPEKKPEPKPSEKKDSHTSHGIYHANPAKRAESHRAVRKLLDKPLKAHEASEKLKPHMDDAKLHTDIAHFAKASPDTDMRPIVKKRMEQLRKQRGF
jgi:hypothetical protein